MRFGPADRDPVAPERSDRGSARAHDAAEADDIGTRSLFETTVMDEDGYRDWLDRKFATPQRIGEPDFMSIRLGKNSAEA